MMTRLTLIALAAMLMLLTVGCDDQAGPPDAAQMDSYEALSTAGPGEKPAPAPEQPDFEGILRQWELKQKAEQASSTPPATPTTPTDTGTTPTTPTDTGTPPDDGSSTPPATEEPVPAESGEGEGGD